MASGQNVLPRPALTSQLLAKCLRLRLALQPHVVPEAATLWSGTLQEGVRDNVHWGTDSA